jgi:hypothetical protein
MTLDQIALLVLATLSGIMGWLLREMWGAVKSLRLDLDNLRVNIAETYIRRDSLRDALEPLREQLSRIEGGMMHKVDKP